MSKVNSSVIENNRKMFSVMGGALGTGIMQVESRSCDANFEKDALAAKESNNAVLCINREIKRYQMVSHNVEAVTVGEDAENHPYVNMVLDNEAEIHLPVASDFSKIGQVNDNALREALKGNNSIFFNNARKTADALNQLNRNNIGQIDDLISKLNRIKQALNAAITNNEKKAADYERQLISCPQLPSEDGKMHVHMEFEQN